MTTLHHSICTVIPPHMQRHMAEHGVGRQRAEAEAMLRRSAHPPEAVPLLLPARGERGSPSTRMVRRVFDAGGGELLPGDLVLDDRTRDATADVQAHEAFRACGATSDLYAKVFLRNSIDNRGMSIDSTIHYGHRYGNAFWNGRQMIFGDGDGVLFTRFTPAIEVVGHELTHGVVQHSARLPYRDESGALSEHLADVFGMLTLQFWLGHTAAQSHWLIGAGILGPGVKGRAIRSMIAPGTAYDDPILGRDPQVCHMRDYVRAPEDNGGVHINSGIPNSVFATTAQELGGYPWSFLGRIWYRVMTAKLTPAATFKSFAADTVHVAAELYGTGCGVQQTLAARWSAAGVPVPALTSSVFIPAPTSSTRQPRTPRK